MEKTDEKLASLIEKLQDAGFAQAPEVIDGAIRAIHWDGVLQLGFAGLFAGLFLASIVLLFYGLTKENDEMGIAGGIGTVLFLFLMGIVGSAGNPWLQVFDPEATLYQQIISGLLGA